MILVATLDEVLRSTKPRIRNLGGYADMTETELSELQRSLIVEEFKQLHEHLRTHEKEMGSLTIVMVTGSAALLSAIAALYFRVKSSSEMEIGPAFSYLFLVPTLLVIPVMALIRGHRESLYKMGLYIKVFIEKDVGGAAWHVRLEKYQSTRRGESQDGVPYFAWAVSVVAYALFAVTLSQIDGIQGYHYAVPLAPLILLLATAHADHRKIKNIQYIEDEWRRVKKMSYK